jgi:hypothetical protein
MLAVMRHQRSIDEALAFLTDNRRQHWIASTLEKEVGRIERRR